MRTSASCAKVMPLMTQSTAWNAPHTPFAGLKDGTEQRLVTAEGKRRPPFAARR